MEITTPVVSAGAASVAPVPRRSRKRLRHNACNARVSTSEFADGPRYVWSHGLDDVPAPPQWESVLRLRSMPICDDDVPEQLDTVRGVGVLALAARRVAARRDDVHAVRVGDRHDPHLGGVQQRGDLGVDAVTGGQVVDPAPRMLTGGQLAGVHLRPSTKNRGFGGGRAQRAVAGGLLGDADGAQVVPARTLGLLPRVAVVDQRGQRRVLPRRPGPGATSGR